MLVAVFAIAGGCVPSVASARPSPTPFAIEPGSFAVTPSSAKAGGHGDLTVSFHFERGLDERPFNDVKDVVIDLPPGFAGNVSAVPRCTYAQLLAFENEEDKPQCPLDSQVGTITADFTIATGEPARMTLPLFNMVSPGAGVPVELGFRAIAFSQLIPMSVRPTDAGIAVGIPAIPLFAEPSRVSMTIWGVPASPAHDIQRGQECLPTGLLEGEEECLAGGVPAGVPPKPFLDNPTRCGTSSARIEAESWEEPDRPTEAEAEVGPFVECPEVPFSPSVEVRPSAEAAETPTGLDVSILEPQDRDDPEVAASSSLAAATVRLPSGLSIDPTAIATKGVCTAEELERETALAQAEDGCPASSRLGAVEIETPALDEAAVGSLYMASPPAGSTGGLPGLYAVVRAPGSGGFVELSGKLSADQSDGRLTIGFDEPPQLPLSRLTMRLAQAQDALFVTPPTCGSYVTEAELTPSSAPAAPRTLSDSFHIGAGLGGAPCPPDTGLPFHPDLSAVSLNPTAGAFSPVRLHLGRSDGEASPTAFSSSLPPGLVADMSSISPCPDAALSTARAEAGAEERADPACPGSSEVGAALIGLGVGSRLVQVSGSIYLAGPYAGAPLSIAAVVPALLGAVDLGTVVVREGLRLDSRTGRIVIGGPGSDPVPGLMDGLPLHLREVSASFDRPGFTRNPTSCGPLSTQATILPSSTGIVAATPVTSTAPYRVTGCRKLRFGPRLRLRLFGGIHRNGHPGLRLVLTSRRGESALAAASVDLPHTELLDPAHIRGICLAARLAAGLCPASSIYGFAKALTPLLSEPLRGPVYLRSTEHGLPSLVAALGSREIGFDLFARLRAVGGGLRIEPERAPDLPISKLVLETRGGRAGILVNSADLCSKPRRAGIRLSAQNGRHTSSRPELAAAC